tara:strand:+ start:181 stop:1023 length:843 start_codon:yes stop_codon:yes gene_type:complete
MKTFRRPMFRKGGNVGTGVMTGIVDRGNYSTGTPKLSVGEQDITDYISLVKGGDQAQSSDPLTDFLLQFGPNLLSATPTGGGGFKGLLSTAGGAAKEPLQDLIKNKRAQRSEDLALRAKAIDTLGVDELKKVRAQAKMSVGPQLENETSEEYATRVENKMGEFIDSTYAKSQFLKTDSPEEKVYSYAESMVKAGDMKDMPTAKNRSNFELNNYDKLKAAKVNIQLPRAKKLFNKKNELKRNVNQGVYYDDITDTYTRVVVNENGQLEAIKNITFEELIKN